MNKFIKAACLGFLVIGTGCNSGPVETLADHQPVGSQQQSLGNSEAKSGPDDAFFVQVFIEGIVTEHLDEETVSLELSNFTEPSFGLASNAFSYEAHFQKERIDLAVDWLFYEGDSDASGGLDQAEFSQLKMSPSLLGNDGQEISLDSLSGLFDSLASDGQTIYPSDLRKGLISMGKLANGLSYREQLERWEAVINRHDKDGDGQLDLEEHRNLRDSRRSKLDDFRQKLSN